MNVLANFTIRITDGNNIDVRIASVAKGCTPPIPREGEEIKIADEIYGMVHGVSYDYLQQTVTVFVTSCNKPWFSEADYPDANSCAANS